MKRMKICWPLLLPICEAELKANPEKSFFRWTLRTIFLDNRITVPKRGDKKKLLELSEEMPEVTAGKNEKNSLTENEQALQNESCKPLQTDFRLKEIASSYRVF